MKVLGLSCGRKMQNTDILIKEALMGAEEKGADVEFINMLSLELKPCLFCKDCKVQSTGKCIINDDGQFLYDRIMECDGFILGAPVYSLTPPGILKMFEDRMMGPKADVAFAIEAKKLGANDFRGTPRFIDERLFKKRVGAFISLGGASTPNWLSFGLALLHTMTFPPQIELVDQMQVYRVGQFGHVAMNPKPLARARKLGRHVAEALGARTGKLSLKWRGDEMGTCPVCHSNLLTVKDTNPIECPICGISGTIKVTGKKIKVTFSKKEQERSRLTIPGKREHFIELTQNYGSMRPDLKAIGKKLEKYRGYAESKKPKTARAKQ
jgi:multimeric flavodoxin WrbA